MDSPLNLAHRCHRKAEYYLNERRYQEAIGCHLRAAQHLSEALLSTSCDKIKTSLETQKSFHLSQEKVLKQKQLCENQRVLNYRQELKNRQLIRERFGFDCDQRPAQSPMQANPSQTVGSAADSKSQVMSEIMDVFSEHDSLLQFLIERRAPTQSSPVSPSESTSAVVTSSDSLYKSASKRPKDDKTVIEELQTVNEKLRQLVFQLYSELEVSQKENRILQMENPKLKDENRNTISSTVPELPPLEPPELLY